MSVAGFVILVCLYTVRINVPMLSLARYPLKRFFFKNMKKVLANFNNTVLNH